MPDAMMRVAGRAGDGTARALSVAPDANGAHVLRVIDAAPVSPRSLPARSALSVTGTVAAGASHTFTIAPPAGEMWRLRHVGFNAEPPAGATTGSHNLIAYYGAASSNLYEIFSINNGFGARVRITGSFPAYGSTQPPVSADFYRALTGIVISALCPLNLVYSNLTNAVQAGTLGLAITKEIEYGV